MRETHICGWYLGWADWCLCEQKPLQLGTPMMHEHQELQQTKAPSESLFVPTENTEIQSLRNMQEIAL